MRDAIHADFKDATDGFKLNNAHQFINRVLNASAAFEIDDKGIQNMVSEYNKNSNGINIQLSPIMGSEGSVVPTIKLNGKSKKYRF